MPENKVNDQQLDEKLARLEQARRWSPRVIAKFEAFIGMAEDIDLFRINPLQYAGEHGLAEVEALDLFLHATSVGLFEMDWHVICPHCGFIIDSLHNMSQLHTHYRCPFCGADRDYALDDYMQVAFSISPQVRDILYHHPESLAIEDYYLNYRLSKEVLSPIPDFPTWHDAMTYVTKFMDYLEPGEKRAVDLELPPGNLRATNSRSAIQLWATSDHDEHARRLRFQLVDGKFQSDDPALQPSAVTRNSMVDEPVAFRFDLGSELPNGRLVIELENMQDRRSALWIYHTGQFPPPMLSLRPGVNGKKLLTNQTFRDLFRSEATGRDEGLAIRDITFLFTDLKGSTAMYEEVGDAKAYFLVRQHFDALGRVIRVRNGAIVKTIGDAVMAVFDNPVEATSAALEMIDALNDFNRTISQELTLKVGIHRGHAMAVTVNERVDYFGQNVNIAARVQALAGADELYMSSDVYDAPGIGDVLQAHQVVPEEVLVKGVSEKLSVYRIGRHQHD